MDTRPGDFFLATRAGDFIVDIGARRDSTATHRASAMARTFLCGCVVLGWVASVHPERATEDPKQLPVLALFMERFEGSAVSEDAFLLILQALGTIPGTIPTSHAAAKGRPPLLCPGISDPCPLFRGHAWSLISLSQLWRWWCWGCCGVLRLASRFRLRRHHHPQKKKT